MRSLYLALSHFYMNMDSPPRNLNSKEIFERYASIAERMSRRPTEAVFSRFTSLNIRVLLHLQENLAALDEMLENSRPRGAHDQAWEPGPSKSASKSASNEMSHEQFMSDLKEKVKEYSTHAIITLIALQLMPYLGFRSYVVTGCQHSETSNPG